MIIIIMIIILIIVILLHPHHPRQSVEITTTDLQMEQTATLDDLVSWMNESMV